MAARAAPAAARKWAACAACCTTCSARRCRARPDCWPASRATAGSKARRSRRGAASVPPAVSANWRSAKTIDTASRTITLEDIEHFAEFTGDNFYAHMDEEAAKANPFFPGRVAHGYLILSFAAGLFVDPAPGPVLANYGLDNLRFLKPVVPATRIKVRLTAKRNPRATTNTARCAGMSASPTRTANRSPAMNC